MGVFRSEEMLLCQILFSQETVYDCIECLGDIGLVEFRDLNASVTQYQRKYVADIRRCEEMERKLRLLEQEIKKSHTTISECIEVPPAPGAKETLSLESNLETLVGEIENVNKSTNILKRNLQELIEQYHVVKKAGVVLQTTHSFFDDESDGESTTTRSIAEKSMAHLKVTTGVVNLEKVPAMEMILWRLGRGMAFSRFIHVVEPFTDPITDAKVKLTVFVIVCQGENLNKKILKTCQAFRCHLHFCPTSSEQRKEIEKKAIKSIKETEKVVQSTLEHRARVLKVAATNFETWTYQVTKLKSILYIMNMLQLDETNEFQSAEVWLPSKDLYSIKMRINQAAEKADNKNDPIIIILDHKEEPPSFNRTNDFTKGFQNLIDAYGISSYREMNPMPFTIITFPFLFAVMFGDIGHGIILAAFGTYLVVNERKLKKQKNQGEIQRIFFEGRYIILLMGIFSIYTGSIYNDFFSRGLNIFGSSWKLKYNTTGEEAMHKDYQLDPVYHYSGKPYKFGLDPIWHIAENKIIFLNSFKMKLSIILGVVHMIFGIVLSLGNHFYFKDYLSITTKFLPQIIFFSFLFGYLVVLIFLKWIMYGPFKSENKGIHCAPNILITFINMMLFKNEKQGENCPQEMYDNQYLIQMVFVFVALICVPWLLIIRTMGLISHENSKKKKAEESSSITSPSVKAVVKEEKREPIGEIVIHQGIETIEFVLGSISHTASYLRLWALSLAHAQLSEVLWNMVFSKGLKARGSAGSIMLVLIFAFWASFTVAILVLMEGLSAFLHTLRLHWVEFQSKFFSASGRSFKPFSFNSIFKEISAKRAE